MGVKVTFNGETFTGSSSELIKTERILVRLAERMTFLMVKLAERIKTNQLGNLKNSTGRLAASVVSLGTKSTPTSVTGTVEAGRGVPYARAVNDGNRAYIIRAISTMTLAPFKGTDGRDTFRKEVLHPAIAGKHYMELGLESMQQEIIENIRESIYGSLKEK